MSHIFFIIKKIINDENQIAEATMLEKLKIRWKAERELERTQNREKNANIYYNNIKIKMFNVTNS